MNPLLASVHSARYILNHMVQCMTNAKSDNDAMPKQAQRG